jgi:anti-sigma factor RsiW
MAPGNECPSVLLALDAWVDGELDPTDATAVARHLSACRSCRAEAALLRAMAHSVRRMPQPEPDPALRARLLAQAREEATTRRLGIEQTEREGVSIVRRYETVPARVVSAEPTAAREPALSTGRSLICQRQVSADGTTLHQVVQTRGWREWR